MVYGVDWGVVLGVGVASRGIFGRREKAALRSEATWVVVKIRAPSWVP